MMPLSPPVHACLAILALLVAPTTAFTTLLHRHEQRLGRLHSSSKPPDDDGDVAVIGVVAPLKYVGPYACLELVFPHIPSKTKGDEGASMRFVLDTGANVNSIGKEMAEELNLPVAVRKEDLALLGSTGAGGMIQAGDIVRLGDCRLGGMPEDQANVTFMRNLTAAALDLGIAQTVGQGLLGTFFFMSFPAGVEFDWYGTDGDPPTMIFYYGQSLPEDAKKNAFCVKLGSLFGVPSLSVNINGIDLRAIIDTGSPITIISPDAAKEVGIEKKKKQFSREDDSLRKIMGIDNEAMSLSRASGDVSISIGGESLGNIEDTCCIGTLPGISLATDLSNLPSPQVLIGLDVMRLTYRMILRLPDEVWFEKLPQSKG